MTSTKYGVFPAVKRIVAIGDLHGDWSQTIRSLQLAKVIKLNGTRWIWCGGTTYIVQLGDQIDRKSREDASTDEDSEIKIMKFLDCLDAQAIKDGGRVLSLAGNHEQLQTKAQFHYVSPKGLAHFGGEKEREKAFRPGGEMALYMAKHRYAVLKVGPFIFAHGSVVPKIADKWDIPKINQMLRDYLTGDLKWNRDLNELFEGNDSILWNRSQAGPRPCSEKLDLVLKKWNGKALILGHTPQEDGITSGCDNKVWRVDVGLSAAIMGSKDKADRVQVLEITQNAKKQAAMKILKWTKEIENSIGKDSPKRQPVTSSATHKAITKSPSKIQHPKLSERPRSSSPPRVRSKQDSNKSTTATSLKPRSDTASNSPMRRSKSEPDLTSLKHSMNKSKLAAHVRPISPRSRSVIHTKPV